MRFQPLIITLLLAGLAPSVFALFYLDHLHTKIEHRMFLALVVFYCWGIGVSVAGTSSESWAQALSAVSVTGVNDIVWNQVRYCGRLFFAQRRAHKVLDEANRVLGDA